MNRENIIHDLALAFAQLKMSNVETLKGWNDKDLKNELSTFVDYYCFAIGELSAFDNAKLGMDI